jgi:hypothetical protein
MLILYCMYNYKDNDKNVMIISDCIETNPDTTNKKQAIITSQRQIPKTI